jgi:hypothetical protein
MCESKKCPKDFPNGVLLNYEEGITVTEQSSDQVKMNFTSFCMIIHFYFLYRKLIEFQESTIL